MGWAMTLKDQVKEFVKFDEAELKNHDRLNFQYENGVGEHGIRYRCLKEGAKYQHARLLPIITALAERVEQLEGALEFYANEDNWDTEDPNMYWCNTIWNENGDMDTGEVAKQALTATSALDAILKEGE